MSPQQFLGRVPHKRKGNRDRARTAIGLFGSFAPISAKLARLELHKFVRLKLGKRQTKFT